MPIAIQALTVGNARHQLTSQTFDDYVKYLPNVSFLTNGPGQGNIYMRGLSAGASAGSQSSGSIGGFPNVAIYLDDQSGQLPGRNLDIYAADLERIEVLEGPQGTLFGAGAQAGVVRYITNKPKLNVTEGNVTAGYSATAHGDKNSNVDGRDQSADDRRPYGLSRGHLQRQPRRLHRQRAGDVHAQEHRPWHLLRQLRDGLQDRRAHGCRTCTGTGNKATAFGVPPGSPVANNNSLVQNNFNPVTYQGIRGSLLYQINDDWNALVTQTYQDMNSQGVFYQMPKASDGAPLQPLEVTLFSPSYDKDKFENTAWTLNGKFGDLKAVYTGGYLVRNIDQTNDYTNYTRGVYADYYQCYGAQG